MRAITNTEFVDAYAGLCRCKGTKVNTYLAELWYERMKGYTHEAVCDAFDAMISGSRGFPTLDEILAWMSTRHKRVGAVDEHAEIQIPKHEWQFSRKMFPTLLKWSRNEITNHRYFREMRMHAEDEKVSINWQEFLDMGYSLPWVIESRYPGDDAEYCKTRGRRNG